MGVLGRNTSAIAALCAAVGVLAPEAAAQQDGAATLLAAGDIANCASSGDEATADILVANEGVVATLGDNAQIRGTHEEFANCYHPSWGRVRERTRPAPGNHDYDTPGAAGYYWYFGAAAGDPSKGYYSYDLGPWHVISLNSNCDIVVCYPGSPQEQWLRDDLRANATRCTLAYWHHARFSSGRRTQILWTEPFWKALYENGADVVLGGHDHIYERFAPQTPIGDPNGAHGIRQFTAGTGGHSHSGLPTRLATSEVANNDTFGVLKLTLKQDGYDWAFLPEAGKTFRDAGSDKCHDAPDDVAPPTVSINAPSTGDVLRGGVTFAAEAADETALARVDFLVDQTIVGRVTAPPYTLTVDSRTVNDGVRTVSARAVDASGNATSSEGRVVTIDNFVPETTIRSGPSGTVRWRSPAFAFSSEPGATFECALDTDDFTPCTSPSAYAGLADGRHRFRVRARDAVGNVDPTPAVRAWTIDATRPQTTVGSLEIRAGRDVVVAQFSANERGATFECSLDKSAWTPCESPQRYALLRPGAHSFRVRARDLAQNADSTPAGRAWSVVRSRGRATVVGSAGADVIVGTRGNDHVRGLGGGDVLQGGDGNDRLEGGPGRDRILGGAGRDTLEARDGERDSVHGGPGRDAARIDRLLDEILAVEARL